MNNLEKAKRLVRACESVEGGPNSWDYRMKAVLEELKKIDEEEQGGPTKSISEYRPWLQQEPGIDY